MSMEHKMRCEHVQKLSRWHFVTFSVQIYSKDVGSYFAKKQQKKNQ